MTNENNLPTKIKSQSIDIHNNDLKPGSLIEQSLTKLNESQVQNLMEKAAEEALRLEVKNREQNMDYITGKKTAEDHIDTFNMLKTDGILNRQKIVSDIKTGAGNMRIESKSGATCFVASVAYDDPNHSDVIFLRYYRDTVLSKYFIGKLFIKLYWIIGPSLAMLVNIIPNLRFISRFCIANIVKILRGY